MIRFHALRLLAVVLLLPAAGCQRHDDPLPVPTRVMDARVREVDYDLKIFSRDPESGRVFGAIGGELYRIVDDGERAEPVYRFPGAVTGVLLTPVGWFVAVENARQDTPRTRLFRSTDHGARFEVVWSSKVSRVLWWSLAASDNGAIFVGEYGPKGPGQSKRVWRSDDGGRSWSIMYEAPDRDGLHIHRVAVDPYTGDIWISRGDGSDNRGVYRSRDGGKTFERLLDSQATGIAFDERYVYLGEDHKKLGRVSRFERASRNYEEIFRASDRGNYGGSVYDIALGSRGTLYVPTMKYPKQDHIISLWAGKGERWDLLVRRESAEGVGGGFQTIAGPDPDGWLYVEGFKIRDQ